MDFNDTAEEAKFREEVRGWLEVNVPTAEELAGLNYIEAAKLWQKRKYDAGWACIRWPEEYGGRGASAIDQVIWNQEEAKYPDLPQGIFGIGQGMAAPTLMTWADDEAKARYLPRLASGEDIWCQLFSEPAGGSDLAALRTKAERDGDDWVINGQKIWTSGAHYSDYGILVVRTDPTVPKHKGLSYFYLDMKSPGIEIKPIKQISGDSNFNEVYFTDVRIPDSQRLGAVGRDRRRLRLRFQARPAGQHRRQAGHRGLPGAGEACRLVLSGSRSALHRLPLHDGAFPGRDPGTGKLHRQAGRRTQDTGHGVFRHRPDGNDGRDLGQGVRRGGRVVPGNLHGHSGLEDRRRHRRDHGEHHRRAGAGAASGTENGQGDPVQRGPHGIRLI
jgi:hypothetical protein